MLVVVRDYNTFELLGQTRDDAAGEALIKLHGLWGILIPAVLISINWQKREILML